MKSLLFLCLAILLPQAHASVIGCEPAKDFGARVTQVRLDYDGDFGFYQVSGVLKVELFEAGKLVFSKDLDVLGTHTTRGMSNFTDVRSKLDNSVLRLRMDFLNAGFDSSVTLPGKQYKMKCSKSY